jgi:predicted component of type VI protein secretion system
MPLTLTIRSVERNAGAPPPPLRLYRRGAVIGRSPSADWTLPDERNAVSSRHCEIAFRDGAYLIADSSTNGTYVNGQRLTQPHRLVEADVLSIGPYEAIVQLVPEDKLAPPGGPVPITPARPQAAQPLPPAAAVEHLLRHAGLKRTDVAGSDADVLAAAGGTLRRLTEGTRGLLAARAKARGELGIAAEAGDNPLKRPGATEAALAALLTPRGEAGATEAFAELEAHQRATLKAMQGAMKATLERFSPAAIRARAGTKASEATLWQEYERAFAGTNAAREDSFIEVFARELRSSYEALAKR